MRIQSLKTNTLPGPAGCTVEFYKLFGHILLEHLYELFLVCQQEKRAEPFMDVSKGDSPSETS